MPEHILPIPPRWEKDLEYGWVTFKRGNDELRGYFAKPKGGTNLPGIVMAPENLGIIEHRQDVTRRLAKAGYACITVDPYSRIGGQSPRDFKDATERRIKASLATPDEQFVPDLQAAADWLAARDDVDGNRIGAIGYCSGGGSTYGWVLGESHNIKCTVIFYGAPKSRGNSRPDGKDLDRTKNGAKLQMPILIHHGALDKNLMANYPAQEAELKKNKIKYEGRIYPNSVHGFFNDATPERYNKVTAEEAWTRTIAWFNQHTRDQA